MKKLKNMFRRLWKEERGQDLVEYALLMVLLVLTAVATLQTLGQALTTTFQNAINALKSAT
jgi:Flp pilus assembly pilin Flp